MHPCLWRLKLISQPTLKNSICSLAAVFAVILLTGGPCRSADAGSAGGEQGTGSSSTSNSPTVVNHSDGNALRLSVINAVINHVNNARQATFRLEWDLLPGSDALDELAASVPARHFTISNGELESKAWTSKIKGDDADILKDALGVQSLADFRPTSPGVIPAMNEDTYLTRVQAAASGADPLLSSDQAVTAQLDHLALRLALSSNGIGYHIKVPDAEVQGGSERSFDKEIRWQITLYPVIMGPDSTDKTRRFYRATLRAELDPPVTLTFPNMTQTSATLRAAAKLKPSPAVIGLPSSFGETNGSINLAPVQKQQLTGADALTGGSAIEGILKFIGNTDLQTAVNSNFLSGTDRASIYYGGLVGQGQVKQLIGVNRILTGGGAGTDLGIGILLGVAPEHNNALFLGPSLETGVFTVAAGAIALQKDKPGGGTKTGIYPAVTLAFDLSKTVGGKRDVQTIKLQDSTIGGRSSDTVARDVFGFEVAVALDTGSRSQQFGNAFVRFRRVAIIDPVSGAKTVITDPQDQTLIAFPVPTPGAVTRYVPRGLYQYDASGLPASYKLFVGNQPVSSSISIPIGTPGQTIPTPFNFVIRRVP